MTRFAQAERQALADVLTKVGPEAPTLCSGWLTADLAAHLVVRERRPDAAPGLVVSALGSWTDRVRNHERDTHSYRELVNRFRRGPSFWNPLALPVLNEAANAMEFFVHHEDVRRAQPDWHPRDLLLQYQQALWASLGRAGRMMMRNAPVDIRLVAEGFGEIPVRTHGGKKLDTAIPNLVRGDLAYVEESRPEVKLTGPPSELMLFAYGRQSVAQVTCTPIGFTENAESIVELLIHGKFGV